MKQPVLCSKVTPLPVQLKTIVLQEHQQAETELAYLRDINVLEECLQKLQVAARPSLPHALRLRSPPDSLGIILDPNCLCMSLNFPLHQILSVFGCCFHRLFRAHFFVLRVFCFSSSVSSLNAQVIKIFVRLTFTCVDTTPTTRWKTNSSGLVERNDSSTHQLFTHQKEPPAKVATLQSCDCTQKSINTLLE